MKNKFLRERLSEYAHEAWSGWMKYMFEKAIANSDGTLTIPKWAVERWSRQMNLSYAELPEDEKESDRAEADKMLLYSKLKVEKYKLSWIDKVIIFLRIKRFRVDVQEGL